MLLIITASYALTVTTPEFISSFRMYEIGPVMMVQPTLFKKYTDDISQETSFLSTVLFRLQFELIIVDK